MEGGGGHGVFMGIRGDPTPTIRPVRNGGLSARHTVVYDTAKENPRCRPRDTLGDEVMKVYKVE